MNELFAAARTYVSEIASEIFDANLFSLSKSQASPGLNFLVILMIDRKSKIIRKRAKVCRTSVLTND